MSAPKSMVLAYYYYFNDNFFSSTYLVSKEVEVDVLGELWSVEWMTKIHGAWMAGLLEMFWEEGSPIVLIIW